MGRPRTLVMLLGAATAFAAGMAAVRHRGAAMGHRVPGGILIGNAAAYDALSRSLLSSLHGPFAADAAAVARDGARVLEVGCGQATCRSDWLACTASRSSVSTSIRP